MDLIHQNIEISRYRFMQFKRTSGSWFAVWISVCDNCCRGFGTSVCGIRTSQHTVTTRYRRHTGRRETRMRCRADRFAYRQERRQAVSADLFSPKVGPSFDKIQNLRSGSRCQGVIFLQRDPGHTFGFRLEVVSMVVTAKVRPVILGFLKRATTCVAG
jgi:hypothetical protein